ncbi:terpene synthase family protein [Streptacidiphilus rugosus]|uniref:terpene synthase family protein n=1 Tax=Streptacidiphilus rugosus TaxID=405783 RepID=UPI000567FBCC|nr:hypothetical protein [Streptacidiphilus rugosus]
MSSASAAARTAREQVLALDLDLPHGRLRASRLHPDEDLIRAEHDAWFRALLTDVRLKGSERIFRECEGVSLMCRVLPEADAERLVGICIAASALFLLDDVADDEACERARADDYLAVLHDAAPSTPGSAPLRLLARTLTRARAGVPARLWTRFVAGFSEVIAAGAGKGQSAIDSYEGYLKVRYADSAFDLVGVAIEHGLGMDLTRTAATAPADLWGSLHQTCFVHTILVNDLLSFRKEYFGAEPMNALSVLARTEGLTLQQAATEVCTRIADAEDAFLTHAAALRGPGAHASPDADLDRYLTAWELMLAGNLTWSLGCARYHGAAAPQRRPGDPLPTRMELHRDRTVFS